MQHVSALSPDGKYRIETYGTNRGITAEGLFPAEGIRIVKVDDGKNVWSMTGYYEQSFLWSPDSRYVSVSYMARIWGETVVVDTNDFSEIALPALSELQKRWHGETTIDEVRPDPYSEAEQWLDDRRLRVRVKWTGTGSTEYSGTYVYDVSKRKLNEIQPNEPAQ